MFLWRSIPSKFLWGWFSGGPVLSASLKMKWLPNVLFVTIKFIASSFKWSYYWFESEVGWACWEKERERERGGREERE